MLENLILDIEIPYQDFVKDAIDGLENIYHKLDITKHTDDLEKHHEYIDDHRNNHRDRYEGGQEQTDKTTDTTDEDYDELHYDCTANQCQGDHEDHFKHINHEDNVEDSEHDKYGHWDKTRLEVDTHNDGYAHYEEYIKDHNDYYEYSEEYVDRGYDKTLDYHDDYDIYDKIGFDHRNYIPSKPVYNLENFEKIRDTINLYFYSYDKNKFGYEDQDQLISKNVKYNIRIRKVRNLDGSYAQTSWKNLVNGTNNNKISINTKDPLGTGTTDWKSTEGFYQIEGQAYNPSKYKNGVSKTYYSEKSTITFVVIQNYEPFIKVQNGDDFIGYTFGATERLNQNGDILDYLEDNKQKGIPIKFLLKDEDKADQHKAKAFLIKDNKKITSEFPVTFSNERIQGNSIYRDGYVFIPFGKIFNTDIAQEDVKVGIFVEDFKKGDFNKPAGFREIIYKENSEKPHSRMLKLDLDLSAPKIKFENIPEYWTNKAKINIKMQEPKGIGISKVETIIYPASEPFDETKFEEIYSRQTRGLNNYSKEITLDKHGIYRIACRVTDRGNNITTKISDDIKVAPLEAEVSIIPKHPSSLPASENFLVTVDTHCKVPVAIPTMNILGQTITNFKRETDIHADDQVFTAIVSTNPAQGDGDYDTQTYIHRTDNPSSSSDQTQYITQINNKIRIMTPLDLQILDNPTIATNEETTYKIKTTKYVNKVVITLYEGTAHQKEIELTSTSTDDGNSKIWEYKEEVPEIDGNTNMTVQGWVPSGKTETLKYKLLQLQKKDAYKHTEDWFSRILAQKSEVPLDVSVYFSGEKIIYEYIIGTAKTTPLQSMRLEGTAPNGEILFNTNIPPTNTNYNNPVSYDSERQKEVKLDNVDNVNKCYSQGYIEIFEDKFVEYGITQGDTIELTLYLMVDGIEKKYKTEILFDNKDGMFKGFREW